jgi:lysozyme family protein
MNMNFDKAFNILLQFEGTAFTDYNNDMGGETKYGISKAAYPSLNIAALTEFQAKAIYGTDYWLKSNCQKLKPELQYAVFDTAVNMGTETAVRLLQEAAGIKIDGIFGAQTLVQSDTVSVYEYLLLRQWRYSDIAMKSKSQMAFLSGWTNRNRKIYEMYKQGLLA